MQGAFTTFFWMCTFFLPTSTNKFPLWRKPLTCVWVTRGNPCGHRGGHSRDRSEATRFRKEAELREEPRVSLPFKLMRLRTGSQLGLASYTIVSFLHSVCIFSPVCGNTRFQFLNVFIAKRRQGNEWGPFPQRKPGDVKMYFAVTASGG